MSAFRSRVSLFCAAASVAMLLIPVAALRAQDAQDAQDVSLPPVEPAQPDAVTLTQDQIQQLVAPIALYPDPLIAQILPAATYPVQIVDAERFLQANPTPTQAQIDSLNFEPSVAALMHYPSVLKQMNDQLDWTQSLGVAFLNQQGDVMNAIQQLRLQAQNNGALLSNPQEQVVDDDDGISIVPAQPDVIYVPQYDPNVIYTSGGAVIWGSPFVAGIWLDNGVDWHNHWVASGRGWDHGWDDPRRHPDDGRGHGGPPVVTKQWVRNAAVARPVLPRAAIDEARRAVRPGYVAPHPAPAPVSHAFGGYENHATVQREVNRAQQSRPPARPAAPARPAPAPRPAPPPAFHPDNGRAAAAASARGNASRGRK